MQIVYSLIINHFNPKTNTMSEEKLHSAPYTGTNNINKINKMSKRVLIITYKPDVLHMIEHNGSKEVGKNGWIYNYDKGLTARSERESFRNIKTKEKAKAILNIRNRSQILVAKYGKEII